MKLRTAARKFPLRDRWIDALLSLTIPICWNYAPPRRTLLPMNNAIIETVLVLAVSLGAAAQNIHGYNEKSILSVLKRSGVEAKALSSVKPLGSEEGKEALSVAVLSESSKGRQVSVLHRVGARFQLDRSEERRVGKECRSRWA